MHEMLRLKRVGLSNIEIARQFNANRAYIFAIVLGKGWRYIPRESFSTKQSSPAPREDPAFDFVCHTPTAALKCAKARHNRHDRPSIRRRRLAKSTLNLVRPLLFR